MCFAQTAALRREGRALSEKRKGHEDVAQIEHVSPTQGRVRDTYGTKRQSRPCGPRVFPPPLLIGWHPRANGTNKKCVESVGKAESIEREERYQSTIVLTWPNEKESVGLTCASIDGVAGHA